MITQVLAEQPVMEQDTLETLVQQRLGGRIRNLRIRFCVAGVVLQGQAGTYHAKQLAQHAVMELADKPILANEIEVL